MKLASSEARNTIVFAISDGLPNLPKGMASIITSSVCDPIGSGAITSTVMLKGVNSKAFVNPIIPALFTVNNALVLESPQALAIDNTLIILLYLA